MRVAATFSLFLVAGCSSAPVPSEKDIRVAVFSHDKNCTIREVPLPCSDIGSKLKSMGVSPKQHIHLTGDSAVSYELMRSAIDSLERAGYSTNVGFVTN
jgi:biopolymer transport protein ExbD